VRLRGTPLGLPLSKINGCTTSWLMLLAAVRCWKLSFNFQISMAGLAAGDFLEIAFLKSVKIAEGPVLPRHGSASHTSLALTSWLQ